MQFMLRVGREILRVATVLALIGVSVAPSAAEPRLLGINDLTPDQQKILWERVDRVANYASILKACVEDTHFESRFVEAVKSCIEPQTVTRVVDFYRSHLAAFDQKLNRKICADDRFTHGDLAKKMNGALDNLVTLGHGLCLAYLKTGILGR
jgi:hypothetical protein